MMAALPALGIVFRHLEAEAFDLLDVPSCGQLSLQQLLAYRDIVMASRGKIPAPLSAEDWASVATLLRCRGFVISKGRATWMMKFDHWNKVQSTRRLAALSCVVGASTSELSRKYQKMKVNVEFALAPGFVVDTFVNLMVTLSQHSAVILSEGAFLAWSEFVSDRTANHFAMVESWLRECGMWLVPCEDHPGSGRATYVLADDQYHSN